MAKILVIEDEDILRNEVMQWLTLEDYEAFGADNGIDGVEAAIQHQPDLIICDITMPHLDGYGVLLELRTNPSTVTTPFIFVTARTVHEDVRRGMELGADDYLTKPFTRLELLRAVQTRLEKKALQEQKYENELEQWRQAFKVEHEQRLLKAKLVAMFSHDFRNPLASIQSSNNLLRNYFNRMDDHRRMIHFNRIDASIQQLLQMLDDMLLVAQMEMGTINFKPEPINIGEFLQQIIEEFQIIYSETHEVLFENHFSAIVTADPRLIRQIASNLISNAVKYSPQGSKLTIDLKPGDGHYHFTVRDEGVGIPETDRARIFLTFQRGSNVQDIAGTGLGLAIVKQAVDLHGGSICIESKVGIGTTVEVKLPIHLPQ